MRFRRLLALLLVLLPPDAASAQAAQRCTVGVYRGSGDLLVIVERPDTSTTGAWRYIFADGRFGLTSDRAVRCVEGGVEVAGSGEVWPRTALRTTSTRFRNDGIELAGQLIEPPASASGKPPLVVLVHGSENSGWIDRNYYPYLLAAQGIAAFQYDKRGTGASTGSYTQNFHVLAGDVAAAAREARRLAAGRHGRFGLFGGSQGGWVAPRAANDAGAEFVAIGFGLLIDPLEEDAEQVQSELRAAGEPPEVLAAAREVTDATGALMAGHFACGYEALADVRRRYGDRAWFKRIKGEFSGEVLALDEATLRREGRAKLDNLDIDWRYDALGWLRKARMPQLWVIAGADREAPPGTTIERLQLLRAEGQPIEIWRFPNTDHGMVEFTEDPDGTRTPTRITDGYFRLLTDWVKGRVRPPYGSGEPLDTP